jgi:glycosyltransferase involved in cell wall biosynthesis
VRLAVVVTTYNRPDALGAVLAGDLAQQRSDFELIVADDGSTPDTGALVQRYAARAPFPLRHVWHPDEGFRAGAIRNRAIAATDADYVVFTDGDCVPRSDFVAQHAALAERGYFLAGNRMLLSPRCTRRVLEQQLPIHAWPAGRWLQARLAGEVNRVLPLVALPDGAWRKRSPSRWEGVKTCNLSAWRDDLVRVNGFDQAYSGWGLEDSDLVIRLLHAGVKHKSARFATPLFHLWHAENDRSHLGENRARLEALLGSRETRAAVGLDRCR